MAEKSDKLEIYRDKRGKYRWRRVDCGGRIVGRSTEGYERQRDCEANMTRGTVATDKWEFYQDRAGHWRWRRMARNGEIVGCASEGFRGKEQALANAVRHGFGI